MTTPDVSIVMAARHPQPDWLRAAVASALAEDSCAIELVVVDDGANSSVADLLREFGDARVRLIEGNEHGVGAARNLGTRAASGRFVRYLDADDVLEPRSTSRLLALADSGAIVYGTTLVCDEQLAPVRRIECSLEGNLAVPCLLGEFDVRLSWLFPRHVLDRMGEWDRAFRVCEDWDFVLRALEIAPARGSAAVALRYRRHDQSLTRTAGVAEAEIAARRVVRRYFERHPKLRGTRLERRALAAIDIDKALGYAHMRDRRASLARIGHATRRDPVAVLRAAPTLARVFSRRGR